MMQVKSAGTSACSGEKAPSNRKQLLWKAVKHTWWCIFMSYWVISFCWVMAAATITKLYFNMNKLWGYSFINRYGYSGILKGSRNIYSDYKMEFEKMLWSSSLCVKLRQQTSAELITDLQRKHSWFRRRALSHNAQTLSSFNFCIKLKLLKSSNKSEDKHHSETSPPGIPDWSSVFRLPWAHSAAQTCDTAPFLSTQYIFMLLLNNPSLHSNKNCYSSYKSFKYKV